MRYNRMFKETNSLTPTTYTQQLSEYIENLKFEDIPAEVVERAKMLLIQTMGAAISAVKTPVAEKILKMGMEANGGFGGDSIVWGTGDKLSTVNAAFVLGTMCDIQNWEDCSWTGHPAAAAIPCAWLSAAERNASGKDLITAIVAAYEAYHRIAMSVQPTEEQFKLRGWGKNSWQLFAAILSTAKIYGLDARKINQSIGMGCEWSTIPTSHHVAESDLGHYEQGFRARDGVLIAKCTEKGIHNCLDAMDAPLLYAVGMCGKPGTGGPGKIAENNADMGWLVRNLGTHFYIMDAQIKKPVTLTEDETVKLIKDLKAGAMVEASDAGKTMAAVVEQFRTLTAGLKDDVRAQLEKALCNIENVENVAAVCNLTF